MTIEEQLKTEVSRRDKIIQEQQAMITELKTEIQAIHTILDGARLSMPADFKDLGTDTQERAMSAGGRVQNFLISLIACPMRIGCLR